MAMGTGPEIVAITSFIMLFVVGATWWTLRWQDKHRR